WVDDCTRECLALIADTSISGSRAPLLCGRSQGRGGRAAQSSPSKHANTAFGVCVPHSMEHHKERQWKRRSDCVASPSIAKARHRSTRFSLQVVSEAHGVMAGLRSCLRFFSLPCPFTCPIVHDELQHRCEGKPCSNVLPA